MNEPPQKDLVIEARRVLKDTLRIHALHDANPKNDEDVSWLVEALANENIALRERLAEARQNAFRDGRFALMGIHGSTNPDPTHRKGFTAGVNTAIQALEATARKGQP